MYIKLAIFVAAIFASTSAVAQQNVVLLKNGNILQGAIQQDGDRVQVRTSSSRVIIKREEVAYFCNSKSEAYELTQAESNPESVDSQIAVLHWCMKHKMYQQAHQQIGVLQLLPIKRDLLDHLNRQVNVAIDQQNLKHQRALAQLAAKPSNQSPVVTKPAGQIAQVGYDKPIEITALPLPGLPNETDKPAKQRVATLHEIREFSQSFPSKTVMTYKRAIEPHLIRNCFNAGCHNADQKSMPLISLGRGKIPTKTMSQRNFHTLMQYVDLEAPLKSPLYENATTAHGGLQTAVYTDKRGQTKTLREWLLSIATPQAQQAYQQQQFEIAQREAATETLKESDMLTPMNDGLTLPGEIRQTSATLPDSSIPSVPNLTPRQKVFVPKDPFDPEIFNRRFGKKK